MSDLIVVVSKLPSIVKGASKANGNTVNSISGDFAAALDRKVRELITDAVMRARLNGRKTVMGKDV